MAFVRDSDIRRREILITGCIQNLARARCRLLLHGRPAFRTTFWVSKGCYTEQSSLCAIRGVVPGIIWCLFRKRSRPRP